MQRLFTVESWFSKGYLKMRVNTLRLGKWIGLAIFFFLLFGALGSTAPGPKRVFKKIIHEARPIVELFEKTVHDDFQPAIVTTSLAATPYVPVVTQTNYPTSGPLRVHPQNPRYFTGCIPRIPR